MATFAGRYAQPVIDQFGNARTAATGATVRVRLRATGAVATIYSDRNKTAMANNPVPGGVALGQCGLDVDGNLVFYAEPGDLYDFVVTIAGVDYGPVAISGIPPDPGDLAGTAGHPDLAAHDTLGLATQAELNTHAATPHGGTHPDLAAHDTLGLATQTELNTHAATSGHTHPDLSAHDAMGLATDAQVASAVAAGHPNLATHDSLGLATQAELDAHAATPHSGGSHPDLAAHDTLGLTTQAELNAHAATPHGSGGGGTLPTATKATLPAPGTMGRVFIVTDDQRGLWADTGTTWIPIGQELDPRWFGAKCDSNGTMGNGTDDTAAWRACRDVVRDSGIDNAHIIVPPGISRMTAVLSLTNGTLLAPAGGIKNWRCAIFCDWPPPLKANGQPQIVAANVGVLVDAQTAGAGAGIADKENITVHGFRLFSQAATPTTNTWPIAYGVGIFSHSQGTTNPKNITVSHMWIHDFDHSGINVAGSLFTDDPAKNPQVINLDHNKITHIAYTRPHTEPMPGASPTGFVTEPDGTGGGGIQSLGNWGSCNYNHFEHIGKPGNPGQDYIHAMYGSGTHWNWLFIGNTFRNCWDAIHCRDSDYNENITIAENIFSDSPANINPGYVYSVNLGPNGNGLLFHDNIVECMNPMSAIFQFVSMRNAVIHSNVCRTSNNTVYLMTRGINVDFDPGVVEDVHASSTKNAVSMPIIATLDGFTVHGGRIRGSGRGVYVNPNPGFTNQLVIRDMDIVAPLGGIVVKEITDGLIEGNRVRGAVGIGSIQVTNCVRVPIRRNDLRPLSGNANDISMAGSQDCPIVDNTVELGVIFTGAANTNRVVRGLHVNAHSSVSPFLARPSVPTIAEGAVAANVLTLQPTRADSFILNFGAARSINTISGYEFSDGTVLTFLHTTPNTTWVNNAGTPATGAIFTSSGANLAPIAGQIVRFVRMNGAYYQIG